MQYDTEIKTYENNTVCAIVHGTDGNGHRAPVYFGPLHDGLDEEAEDNAAKDARCWLARQV